MEVGLPVLPGDAAHQRGDFILPLAVPGLKLLFRVVEDAHGDVVGRPQSGDAGQLDVLLPGQTGETVHDLLPRVQAQHIALGKFPIFHQKALLP